jgi:hypothetical protein
LICHAMFHKVSKIMTLFWLRTKIHWNIVESCAKHHNPNSYFSLLWNCQIFEDFIDNFIVVWKKHRYLKEEQQNEEPSAKPSLNNTSINEWKLSDILEKNHPLKLQFMIILGISFSIFSNTIYRLWFARQDF